MKSNLPKEFYTRLKGMIIKFNLNPTLEAIEDEKIKKYSNGFKFYNLIYIKKERILEGYPYFLAYDNYFNPPALYFRKFLGENMKDSKYNINVEDLREILKIVFKHVNTEEQLSMLGGISPYDGNRLRSVACHPTDINTFINVFNTLENCEIIKFDFKHIATNFYNEESIKKISEKYDYEYIIDLHQNFFHGN
jgi:hypothetical protein